MRLAPSVLVAVLGCAGAKDSLPPDLAVACGERPEIAGVCVGVSDEPVCGGELCTASVSCSRTWTVRDDASLGTASAAATAGECIALAPGTYGAVTLRGGVHLLGRGVTAVELRAVAFEGGGRSLLRGVAVVGGNVRTNGVALDLDRIAVRGAPDIGVDAVDATVTANEITVENGASMGIAVRCNGECAVGRRPRLVLRRTWVHAPSLVGVFGAAVDADLRYVVVDGSRASTSFLFGRGVEVVARSTLTAALVRVTDCADSAVSLFSSVGTLGPGLEVRRAVRGLVLQGVPEGGVLVDGFTIDGTLAVGVAIGAGSRGVTLRNGSMRATRLMTVPVDIGGAEAVGDGLQWGNDAEATIEPSVRIEASARRPAVIAAGARGRFAATLAGGDEGRGVFVRGAPGPSAHPDLTFAAGIKVEYGDSVPIATDPGAIPR